MIQSPQVLVWKIITIIDILAKYQLLLLLLYTSRDYFVDQMAIHMEKLMQKHVILAAKNHHRQMTNVAL